MNWLDKVRKGGDVTRFHTSNMIKSQDVAQHSFNAAFLAYQLASGVPDVRRDTCVMHMLLHDIPEQTIGDTPGPAKSRSNKLRDALDEVEMDWCEDNMAPSMINRMYNLTYNEELICKFADLAECAFKFIQEVSMGNRTVADDARICYNNLSAMMPPNDIMADRFNEVLIDMHAKMEEFNV